MATPQRDGEILARFRFGLNNHVIMTHSVEVEKRAEALEANDILSVENVSSKFSIASRSWKPKENVLKLIDKDCTI